MSETMMDEWRDQLDSDDTITTSIHDAEDDDLSDMLRDYRTLLRALTLMDAGGQLDNAKLASAIDLARRFA